jgi:hypothetical protein
MTTAMHFLEPRMCRRRCDHDNDLENPLLEATSSNAEGDHKQESSEEDPSTPFPKRLMLALSFAVCIDTMAITIYNLKTIPLFLLGGVIGVFFLVLAISSRFVHSDVKDEAFFGIFLTAGIAVGLAVKALDLIVADGVKNYPCPPPFAAYLAGIYIHMFAGCLLAFWIGYFLFNSFHGGDEWISRFQELLGCYGIGLSIGYVIGYGMSLLLAFANLGLQEGARPKLLSGMLAFCFSVTVAFFLVTMLALAQREAKDDDKEDEVENPTSALIANKTVC